MFLAVAKKSRAFFSVSHVWLMSKWAGAGREHSQAVRPSWAMEVFHTMDIMLGIINGSWLGHRIHEFCEFCEFHSCCSGQATQSVIGK